MTKRKALVLLFTISGDNPTTIGTLYRPPNGNLEKALDELSSILDIASKQTHIAGDFNIDLHDTNSKCIQDYENVIFSKGFFPTISTITHETVYKQHEDEKKNKYLRHVLEMEECSFTPLVLPTHGGCAPEADKFHKR